MMILEFRLELAGSSIPDPLDAALAGRGNVVAVVGKRDVIELVGCLVQMLQPVTIRDRPDRHVPAARRGGQSRTRGIETQRAHLGPGDGRYTFPRGGVVDMNRLTRARREP